MRIKIKLWLLNLKYWWAKVKFVYQYEYQKARYGEAAAEAWLYYFNKELKKRNDAEQIKREIEEMTK